MTLNMIHIAAAVILLAGTLIDLRTGKIPNWLIFGLVALFIAATFVMPDRSAILWQVAFALGVFVLGLVIYAAFGFGAGAVKLLTGAALFLPMDRSFAMFGILLVTMFALGFVVFMARLFWGNPESKWVVLSKNVMPLSLPVCATSMLGLFWLA